MNKALVLLALLAVAFATSTERVEHENNAADALVEELESMEAAIREEQLRHDELHQEQDDECAVEFAFRDQEIRDAEHALEAADAARGKCENAQTRAEEDLQKSLNYISSIQEILTGLAAQRLAEHDSFVQLKEQELEPAIQAIEEAYPILRDFASQTVGFVQFSNHLNKMFTKMVKANKVNSFASIVTVLLSVPEFQHGISHDVIEQLEVLFEQLQVDLENALSEATETENAAVQRYEQTVNEYNAILATLDATVNNLRAYIEELKACVSNESAIAQQAAAKKQRNSEALQYAVDMCQAFDTEYNNSTAARDEELALLGKLRAFVRQQEDIFGNYGNDGVNAYDQFQQSQQALLQENRKAFMQMKLKKFRSQSNFKAPTPSKCANCSRKSFVQKKLGF